MSYTQSIRIDLPKDVVDILLKKLKHKSLNYYVNDKIKSDLLK